MTEQELKEIEARVNDATPGPWTPGSITIGIGDDIWEVFNADYRYISRPHDANFIAHAREDIPNLLAEVRKKDIKLRNTLDYVKWCLAEGEPLDIKTTYLLLDQIETRVCLTGNELAQRCFWFALHGIAELDKQHARVSKRVKK